MLINNAGVSLFGIFQTISNDDRRKMYATNLFGTLYVTREFVGDMINAKSGVIINISSVLGETGGSCEADYAASKGALIALTKSLAKECGPSGVRVNCVCPGIIDTDMNANLTADDVEELVGEIPLETLGRPSDVAKAVLFLASDGAEYITGAVVDVNGLQIDGRTADVMPSEPLDAKFAAFNWNVIHVDGHDLEAIASAFDVAKSVKGKPTVILAKTIKGKGVSFMENNAGWHGKAPNDEQMAQAKEELEAKIKELEAM